LGQEQQVNVKNSVAFVSGANRGIGRAFVEQLLRRGVKKVYAGARDISKLSELVTAGEGRVVAVSLDISVASSAHAAARTAGPRALSGRPTRGDSSYRVRYPMLL
jgi:NAD(P)-dependent dehydrogenase (short-subunit alcohol dehydrogenase family)